MKLSNLTIALMLGSCFASAQNNDSQTKVLKQKNTNSSNIHKADKAKRNTDGKVFAGKIKVNKDSLKIQPESSEKINHCSYCGMG
jgi:guanyl-specific ribonuclease Sa